MSQAAATFVLHSTNPIASWATRLLYGSIIPFTDHVDYVYGLVMEERKQRRMSRAGNTYRVLGIN